MNPPVIGGVCCFLCLVRPNIYTFEALFVAYFLIFLKHAWIAFDRYRVRGGRYHLDILDNTDRQPETDSYPCQNIVADKTKALE